MKQPTMKLTCAWCGKGLGAKPCQPSQAGQTSHGICEGCLVRMLGGEG